MKRVPPGTVGSAIAEANPSLFRNLACGALACALLCLGSGCASLVSGKHREVTFKSKPEGAKLAILDAQGVTVAEGVTPFTAKLRKGKAYFAGQRYTLTFRKEGYCDTRQEIESTVSGWYFGNLLFGGVIGLLVVDPHTGAMYTFPKEISAKLTPTAAAAAPGDSDGSDDPGDLAELRAVNLQDVPAPLRGRLIRVN